MLKNYLKITLRSLLKYKVFVSINIVGLGLALACCIVAYLNSDFNWDFDKNHAQIDNILELLLAPAGQTPESYRFLNEVSLLANLDQIIDDIQAIYGFSDSEVTGFFVNNNP